MDTGTQPSKKKTGTKLLKQKEEQKQWKKHSCVSCFVFERIGGIRWYKYPNGYIGV